MSPLHYLRPYPGSSHFLHFSPPSLRIHCSPPHFTLLYPVQCHPLSLPLTPPPPRHNPLTLLLSSSPPHITPSNPTQEWRQIMEGGDTVHEGKVRRVEGDGTNEVSVDGPQVETDMIDQSEALSPEGRTPASPASTAVRKKAEEEGGGGGGREGGG